MLKLTEFKVSNKIKVSYHFIILTPPPLLEKAPDISLGPQPSLYWEILASWLIIANLFWLAYIIFLENNVIQFKMLYIQVKKYYGMYTK